LGFEQSFDARPIGKSFGYPARFDRAQDAGDLWPGTNSSRHDFPTFQR
jgi:hypothetical protein